jgi:hypothetical protein
MQIPKTKSQIPNKNQFSNSNYRDKDIGREGKHSEFRYSLFGIHPLFGAWSLVLVWNPVLGI